MEVNFEKLNKKFWYEDENGNEIEMVDGVCGSDFINRKFKNGEIVYYKRCFPLELHQFTDEFCYHPKNPIIKFLCRKSYRFYKWIARGKHRTYRNILDCTTTFGSGQDCIVAMVNSGDYTLEQAIWVYANACERCIMFFCINILMAKMDMRNIPKNGIRQILYVIFVEKNKSIRERG